MTIYKNGRYLQQNPTWHIEDSAWKTKQILRMILRNNLSPKSICEVGCGTGENLRQLKKVMDKECKFWGYEISPQAYELCKSRANQRLQFTLGDITNEDVKFDLILLIDILEHIEDYFAFLRQVKGKGRYKIIHIPLELSVLSILRTTSLLKRRDKYGHIHHFTKDIFFHALGLAGYEVLDYFYTPLYELPKRNFNDRIMKLPRKVFFTLNKDWAVKLLGGYSLMILA